MSDFSFEWVIVLLIFYAIGWVGQQAEKQKRKQKRAPRPRERPRPPGPEPGPSRPDAGPEDGRRRARDMLPDDLWQEIEALARGERPAPPAPTEAEPAPAPVPAPRRTRPEVRSRAEPRPSPVPLPEPTDPPLPARRSRAPRPLEPLGEGSSGWDAAAGDPPGIRRAPTLEPLAAQGPDLPALGETPGLPSGAADRPGARTSRGRRAGPAAWLVDAPPGRLRQAILLHAILGPPVALRGGEPRGMPAMRDPDPG